MRLARAGAGSPTTARRVIAVAVAGFGALACSAASRPVEQAAARFEQHRAVFQDFDRWARRAVQDSGANAGERAVAEAVFAKLRSEPSVASAWVQLGSERKLELAWPAAAPVPVFDHAVRLRDRALGDVAVQLAVPCAPQPKARSAAAQPTPATCTVVARSQPGARGELRVAVAFIDTAPAAQP